MDSDDLEDDSSNSEDKAVVSYVLGTLYAMMQLVEEEEDDDDEEKEARDGRWGGRKGKTPNMRRDFEGAYETLVQQYFSGPSSLYNEDSLRGVLGRHVKW